MSFVKFSPNGKFVLAGTLDDKLRLWNVSNVNGEGGVVKTYIGRQNTKFCCSSAFSVFNLDRQRILAGSVNGSVYIWSINSRNLTQILKEVSNCEERSDELEIRQLRSKFICPNCFSLNAQAAFIAM